MDSDLEKKQSLALDSNASERQGSVETSRDAIFGDVAGGGPNYRNVGWLGTVFLMAKTQIGLGVLSIPLAFDSLGIVPGVICLLVIAVITTWSGYMIGVFQSKHSGVYGLDDVGRLAAGTFGFWFMGTVFYLYWVFVAASAELSISIALNALSSHATCTAVFVAVAAIVGFGLSSIRTLGRISWLAWIGVFCILTSILTLTISVGVEDKPAAAPPGPWVSDFKTVAKSDFVGAATALSSFAFAFSGTSAFFSIASEMRDPRKYTRSLLTAQSLVFVTYLTIGVVVYYFCGSYVASPALGSAGPTIRQLCYAIALPGLLVTETIVLHIPAKYIFVRMLQGTTHLTSNSLTHWSIWLACTAGTTLISYIIASAIPVFGSLCALIGALLGTLMSFQPYGFMWLYDNWGRERSKRDWKWTFMVCWSVFVIVSGTFLVVAGTYGSVLEIIKSYRDSGGASSWSCADNSNSS